MATMVRKQIYIDKRQEKALKRAARSRGVSEAAVIRDAIDRQLHQGALGHVLSDAQAWERAHRFMLALHAQGPAANRPRRWTRDELYAERVERDAKRTD